MRSILVLAVCAEFLLTSTCVAQIRDWDANGASPPNGLFGVANNWNPNSVPTIVQQARFNIADTYTVTFTGDHPSLGVTVSAGTVSFESDSATVRNYTVANGGLIARGGELNIGDVGVPVKLSSTGFLGVGDSSSDGTVTVAGSGSVLDGNVALIGSNSTDGTLTYQLEATGTLGGTAVGGTGVDGSDGNLQIFSDADLDVGNLSVGDQLSTSTGIVTVDGAGSTLEQSGPRIVVVGSAAGGTGTIDVTGDGAFSSGTGNISVRTTGAINIETGGTFNANGPMTINGGSLTRDATGNFALASGLTLTATNDAQLDFDEDYEINDGTTFDLQSGADLNVGNYLDMFDGTLIVDGAGTTVNTNTIDSTVNDWGYNATNIVTVRNEATYSIGNNAHLFLGDSGPGSATLNVESDADFNANTLTVATTPNGTATINLTGSGSTLTQSGASTLTIGSPSGAVTGTGTINVTGDATFSSGTDVIDVFATGAINVGTGGTGGTFNANGAMTIDGGEVNLFDGAMNAGMITLDGGGAFNFTGGELRVDDFNGVMVQDGGTLLIGGSPGITDVSDEYQLNDGTLEIELFDGGVSPVAGTDFDQLTADTATLGGTLDLVIDPNYTPALADAFAIISTTSGVSGTFDNALGAYLGGGLGFDVSYNANDVTIEVVNVLLGDFDVDGDVDGFDFLLWQRDPSVGALSDWQTNYGMVGPLAAAAAAVPEPSGVLLLLIGSVTVLRSRLVAKIR